jgi:GTPase
MSMEPEKDDGNVEYKLKLVGKTNERIAELASQMRYRCEEGGSECIYNIGVEDDGTMIGVTDKEYEESIQVLNQAAEKNHYVVSLLSKTHVEDDKNVYEVLIREVNEDKYIDVKVAVAGSVDSGKTSFLGTITTGILDDGRGSARTSIFNYEHEVRTGRTSSVAHHILGFDKEGDIVNYSGTLGRMTWPEIVKRSSKIISLYDTAGHEKYLKTTIRGLASAEPDLCLIIVGANKGIATTEKTKFDGKHRLKRYENMTREHIFLCITLNIPFAIVVTKIDMIKDQGIHNIYKQTVKDIQTVIRCPGVRRQPIKVRNMEDVLICAKQVHTESIVPIFTISNVSGEGLDYMKTFLNIMKRKVRTMRTKHVELHIDSVWSVSGIGTVIGGHLNSGTIKVKDKLYIGPNNDLYEQVEVRSIHRKRVPVQKVSHGSYVCLALKKIDRKNIRRGNVIVSDVSQHILTRVFTAKVRVLKSHSTSIRIGYEPVVHCSAIRQTAALISITNKVNSRNPEKTKDDDVLRTGDTAIAKFRFCYQTEYLIPGTKLLLCENRTKVVGEVLEIEG